MAESDFLSRMALWRMAGCVAAVAYFGLLMMDVGVAFLHPLTVPAGASRTLTPRSPSPSTFRLNKKMPVPIGQASNVAHRFSWMLAMAASNDPQQLLNPEAHTERSWEAISRLPQYAQTQNFATIEPELLLKSILDEGNTGLAQRILSRAGLDIKDLESSLAAHLGKRPKVVGGSEPDVSPEVIKVLAKANDLKREKSDSFISVEHVLLALLEVEKETQYGA